MHEGPEYLEEGSGGCYTIITLRNHETLLVSCSMQSRQKYRFLVQSAPKRCSYYFDPCIHQDQEQGQARLRDLALRIKGSAKSFAWIMRRGPTIAEVTAPLAAPEEAQQSETCHTSASNSLVKVEAMQWPISPTVVWGRACLPPNNMIYCCILIL